MKISAPCIRCLIERQEERIQQFEDTEKKARYLKEVLRLIGESDDNASAPGLVAKIQKVYEAYFGKTDDFAQTKHSFNQLMLSVEQRIADRIRSSREPLRNALTYARIGNYIDFGAMKDVDTKVLEEMIYAAEENLVDEKVYEQFTRELAQAKHLVYLVDNCGEVVLDKLAIRCIKEAYPQLEITAVVRGKEVLNDVTIEDAKETGLDKVTEVLENGTDIAGTELSCVNEATKQAILAADVIISKGQGNFETLNGCGLNIYYLFLCKCHMFVKRFGVVKNAGVFVREVDLM